MKNLVLGCVFALGVVGCSQAPVQLPANVTTVPTGTGSSTYIDTVDHSFDGKDSVTFDKLKFCVAESFTNDDVQLRDNAGSFIGAYTGTYYEKNNSSVSQGGNVFKYIDDKGESLVATGRTKTNPHKGFLVVDVVQFDAVIKLNSSNKVSLLFKNITRAQESTGAVANNGFAKAGTWSGARAPSILEAIDGTASTFKSCVNQ